jgi:hypothetical protein
MDAVIHFLNWAAVVFIASIWLIVLSYFVPFMWYTGIIDARKKERLDKNGQK